MCRSVSSTSFCSPSLLRFRAVASRARRSHHQCQATALASSSLSRSPHARLASDCITVLPTTPRHRCSLQRILSLLLASSSSSSDSGYRLISKHRSTPATPVPAATTSQRALPRAFERTRPCNESCPAAPPSGSPEPWHLPARRWRRCCPPPAGAWRHPRCRLRVASPALLLRLASAHAASRPTAAHPCLQPHLLLQFVSLLLLLQ